MTILDVYARASNVMREAKHVTINRQVLLQLYPSLRAVHYEYLKKIVDKDYHLHCLDSSDIVKAFLGATISFGSGNGMLWDQAERLKHLSLPEAVSQLQDFIIKCKVQNGAERCVQLGLLREQLGDRVNDVVRMFWNSRALEASANEVLPVVPFLAKDPYLKRFLLAMHTLVYDGHLCPGWKDLPMPADYQVPKVLRAFSVLEYSDELWTKICAGTPLPSRSREEEEIRAATVRVGQYIHDDTGIPPGVSDRFFWGMRKQVADRHHITETNEY